MSDADAAEFLSSYGLTESGLVRLIRTTYTLLGLISFFTAGEDECRAWTIPVNTRAQDARARSIPICRSTSSALKLSAGTSCSKPDQKPTPALAARCVWKGKITLCRTAT